MGNLFTLDSLREETEKKFAPIVIELSDGNSVALSNLLRLPKKVRVEVMEALKHLDDLDAKDAEEAGIDGPDRFMETANKVFMLVADKGKELVAALDGDLTLTMRIMELWMDGTSAGEAPRSKS